MCGITWPGARRTSGRRPSARMPSTPAAARSPRPSAAASSSRLSWNSSEVREETTPMSFISRGFRGKRRDSASSSRLPPGQYVVNDFPVLSTGPTPRVALAEWTFVVEGEIDEPKKWTWEDFRKLPAEEVTKDIHCVTQWTKLHPAWKDDSVNTIIEGVETASEFVMAFSYGGYTTNLPLEDVSGGKAWVAY